jgi:hypothetical protein
MDLLYNTLKISKFNFMNSSFEIFNLIIFKGIFGKKLEGNGHPDFGMILFGNQNKGGIDPAFGQKYPERQ